MSANAPPCRTFLQRKRGPNRFVGVEASDGWEIEDCRIKCETHACEAKVERLAETRHRTTQALGSQIAWISEQITKSNPG
jgi:hypothetical protein